MTATQSTAKFKELRAAGRLSEGLASLQQDLRRSVFDADSLDQVGRLLIRHLPSLETTVKPLSIFIVGQFTTSWLLPPLTAIAWGRGRAIIARDGGYDNVLQDLATLSTPPDVVVIAPWTQRLLSRNDRSLQDRIDDEMGFLSQCWEFIQRSGARLLQLGYDWERPGPAGHHLSGRPDADIGIIRKLNDQIRHALPAGAYFADLEQIAGDVGRQSFYDCRSYFWTRQPFSRVGLARLCEHLWAGIRAVTTGPKKVLVLDLDNTLWGGIVGEVGAMGIGIGETPEGESFRAFQREISGLAARGIVLAACSKNNPPDALEVFEKNPDMVLKRIDFAAFEATWDPKPAVIQRIAQTLGLGLDSFVFFDDNPAEREHVLQLLPEVEVVDVPGDPADYVRALGAGLWFESVGVTDADRMRNEQYRQEHQRRDIAQGAGSVEDYLASLQMTADVRELNDEDMDRAVQLLGKTNQFNLTTRRHTAPIVRQMMAQPGSVAFTVRIADRFGDAGLIGMVLAVPAGESNPSVLRIDVWLMSCRVIARTVEDFVLNQLVEMAKSKGYRSLLGEFIPTAKNNLVADLFDRFGFSRESEDVSGRRTYLLDLSNYTPRATPIQLKTR